MNIHQSILTILMQVDLCATVYEARVAEYNVASLLGLGR